MMIFCGCSHAITSENDKTQSPYFLILNEDENVQMPLLKTTANVDISGIIADVTIHQVYHNSGDTAIEAVYVFPASTRAAVYHMKMKISEREIIAVIQEKQKARQMYEEAKKEGKRASLLEQENPNVFTMNVANIMPGDTLTVEMKYTEVVVPTENIYEFIYPTIVGPRYTGKESGNRTSGGSWTSNPYTTEGQDPLYNFDIHVTLKGGLPLKDVHSPSHDLDIDFTGKKSCEIGLSTGAGKMGNRDFVLKYRLTGSQIQSGLLLHQGKDENFFLAVVQPPEKITQATIPNREYIFILDVSGSMHGFPLDISKKLMRGILGELTPGDRFNVMLFAGDNRLFREGSVPATSLNISEAINFIDQQQGGGGTELLPALKKALALEGTEDFSRSFVIATDGYVTVERETFDLIRQNLNKANFFSFGIGSSVNRFLIDGIANAGRGEPLVVLNPNEAEEKAANFREFVTRPVLTNIRYQFNGIETYDVEPVALPDLFATKPLILYGKYKGKPEGTLFITGNTGKEKYKTQLDFKNDLNTRENPALMYLWAREKIKQLDDYSGVDNDEKLKEEITGLGLKYNLLTRFTSFIAVDTEIVNNTGNINTIRQALPLPRGVSNRAVGSYPRFNTNYKTARKSHAPEMSANYDIVEIEEEEKMENAVFFAVEKQAQFQGGMDKLKDFITSNLTFPEGFENLNISGTIILELIINDDGTLAEVKVLRGLDPLLDKEAVRVIKLTDGKWEPAQQSGKKVKSSLVIPVKF